MSDGMTAAMFTGLELRGGDDPCAFARRVSPDVVAGYGFGDLAALVAADVLDLRDAHRLADLRGQLVAEAGAGTGAEGGLLAVLDVDADAAARCVGALSGARIARHDSPARVVVAGTIEQLRYARLAAEELCLTVAEVRAPGALHSPAMAGAAARFAAALQRVSFRPASRTVYSSVTAAPMRDPREELARCLDSPVLWRQTVRALDAAGAARYVEAGATRMLGELVLQTLAGETPAGSESELVHAV